MLTRAIVVFEELRRWQLEILMTTSVSILIGVAGYGIVLDRSVTMKEAHRNALNLAEALQAQISSQIEQASYSIIGVAGHVQGAGLPSEAFLRQSLSEAMGYDPVSAFLGFVSDDGVLVLNKAGDSVNMPGLSQQIRGALREVQSSSVQLLPHLYFKATASWYVPLAQVVKAKNGRRGIVFSLIPTNDIIKSAASLHLMSEANFSIVTRGGKAIFPYQGQGDQASIDAGLVSAAGPKMLASDHSGTFEFSALHDYQDDIFGYAWSDAFPFGVITVIPKNLLQATWLRRSAIPLLLLLVGGLATVAFAVRLKRAALDLASSHSLYGQLFKSVNDGLLILSLDGTIRESNEGASRILGAGSAQSLLGLNLFSLTAVDSTTELYLDRTRTRLRLLEPGETHADEWRFRRLDHAQAGDDLVDVRLQITAFPAQTDAMATALLRDVTQEQKYLRKQEFLARHDSLTGLLNRYAFLKHLAALASERDGERYAIVLMDLNRFKDINDSLGHHAGDVVLEALGNRLKKLLHNRSVCIARLGGDEIAACIAPALWPEGIAGLCRELGEAVAQTIVVEGVSLEVTAAIGVAMYPDDAITPGQLLRCADIAMYAAKRSKQGYARYARKNDQFTPQWLSLKSDFARAIRDGGLMLAYQPKVRLSDRRFDGFEALSRWTHPAHGPISPAEFIPLAETTELIYPFTSWVVRSAVEQLSIWIKEGFNSSISINISAHNLLSAEFVEEVRKTLQWFKVPPRLLELEITESALMLDQETALRHLHLLRGQGIRLAIDDFGAGYSSLSYLKQLPVDVLKIDRSFIASMEADDADRRIVEWTIRLAHSFGMQVVAEGVETSEVEALLTEMGADVAQGYLYGRPVFAQEACKLVIETDSMLRTIDRRLSWNE